MVPESKPRDPNATGKIRKAEANKHANETKSTGGLGEPPNREHRKAAVGHLLLLGALAIPGLAQEPAWSTVEAVGASAPENSAMAADQTRNILYAASSVVDSDGSYAGAVRRYTDTVCAGNQLSRLKVSNMQGTRFYTVATDSMNRLYAGGICWQPQKNGSDLIYWLIARSDAADQAWNKVYLYQQAKGLLAECFALGIAPNGDLYSSGQAVLPKNQYAVWTVQRSTNQGESWTNVDTYGASRTAFGLARGIGFDSKGSIYVVGQVPAGGGHSWTVRKSSNGGTNWTTLDSNFDPGNSGAAGITVDSKDNIYVTGSAALGESTGRYWVVRSSSDRGATWNTVYQSKLSPNDSATGVNVFTTPNATYMDNVYLLGRHSNPAGGYDWYVEAAFDQSTLGQTSFAQENRNVVPQLAPGQFTTPYGITRDALNNIFVCGAAETAPGVGYYWCRSCRP